jgi:HSP20 family molecular chaperone IbpA
MAVETKTVTQNESVSTDRTPRYVIIPKYGISYENEKYILRVALPGVVKSDIEMKALEDFFTLRATRDTILYRLDLDLDFQVETEKIKAEYKEGLLRVEFTPYNPMEHAFKVPIE